MTSLLIKIWYDLWSNRSRTIQVVLVIALGAIGIGLVVGGRNLIAGTIADQWRAAEPPNIKLALTPGITREQLKTIERFDGVYEAEGTYGGGLEWRLVGDSEWQTAILDSRNFAEQKMELVDLISGDWPDRNSVGVIQTADSLFGVGEGQAIEVRLFNDQIRTFQITGTLKPRGPFPVVFVGSPVFYVEPSTFTRITGRDSFDTLLTRDQVFNQEAAEATDLVIQDYFEDIGVDSVGTLFPFQNRILSPDIPPAAELLNAIFLILGVIGVIIIILGIILVYNSVNAIITQQVQQIGVMKAIGAQPQQIFFSYFSLVFAYGLLAALISIPLGGLGARGLQSLFINLLNLVDPGFTFDLAAIAVQVGVALIAPFFASVFPLLGATRITVREAINTYGLSGGFGVVERVLARLSFIPYSLLLVLSNTLRNRRRLVLIELTLVLAGVVFMMVLGVNEATQYTFGDKLRGIHTYEVNLRFQEPARINRLESIATSDPQVNQVDSWLVWGGKARPVTQADSEVTDARIQLFGLEPDGVMYQPELVSGRWLSVQDNKVVVLSQRLSGEKGWQVGDEITLTLSSGQEDDWQVVGITYDPLAGSAVFVPREVLQKELGLVGFANSMWLTTNLPVGGDLSTVFNSLSAVYESRSFEVATSGVFGETTITEIVEQTQGGFSLIFQLLAIMAVIIAVVGGVGLSGVLTLNVLERRREIGVMRSIGASSRRVIGLSIGEGIVLGWISWLIALPLSIPAAYGLATQGLSLALNQQLSYRFSFAGPLTWLLIITVLAIIASTLPARKAAQVRVRESLSY